MTSKVEDMIKRNARGGNQLWKAILQNNTITVTWGQENGKMQTKLEIYDQGKQKRTPEEQAHLHFNTMVTRKKRDGYISRMSMLPPTQGEESPNPMLVHDITKHSTKITEKVWIQPKLDGIRGMLNLNTGEIWSRQRTKIEGLDHISSVAPQLRALIPDTITWLDGELFHKDLTFNEISSLVRKTVNFTEESIRIQYHVYDCVSSLPFRERVNIINIPELRAENVKYIRVNPTTIHEGIPSEIDYRHSLLTAAGYEGSIIRVDCNNGYECGKRSFSLFKKKDFCQEEYICIGFTRKKISSCDTLGACILKGGNGIEFKATPCMTDEQKKYIWEHQSEYMNKIATVKFFEKSSKGVPRHPNIVGFRHQDDTGKVDQ